MAAHTPEEGSAPHARPTRPARPDRRPCSDRALSTPSSSRLSARDGPERLFDCTGCMRERESGRSRRRTRATHTSAGRRSSQGSPSLQRNEPVESSLLSALNRPYAATCWRKAPPGASLERDLPRLDFLRRRGREEPVADDAATRVRRRSHHCNSEARPRTSGGPSERMIAVCMLLDRRQAVPVAAEARDRDAVLARERGEPARERSIRECAATSTTNATEKRCRVDQQRQAPDREPGPRADRENGGGEKRQAARSRRGATGGSAARCAPRTARGASRVRGCDRQTSRGGCVPDMPRPVRFDDLPTPTEFVDESHACTRTSNAGIARLGGGPETAALFENAQESRHRGSADPPGCHGHLLRQGRRSEEVATAGVTDIRLPHPVSPTNAPRILELRTAPRSRSSSITRWSHEAGPTPCARPAGPGRAGEGRRRVQRCRSCPILRLAWRSSKPSRRSAVCSCAESPEPRRAYTAPRRTTNSPSSRTRKGAR